jgi:hypothetical protein
VPTRADSQTDLEKTGDGLKVDAHDAVEADPIEEIDEHMNKRLERKLDMFIIPIFGVGPLPRRCTD